MSGVIEGATEYMWAAYSVVWAGLAIYGGTLLMRYRKAVADVPPEGAHGGGEPPPASEPEGEPS